MLSRVAIPLVTRSAPRAVAFRPQAPSRPMVQAPPQRALASEVEPVRAYGNEGHYYQSAGAPPTSRAWLLAGAALATGATLYAQHLVEQEEQVLYMASETEVDWEAMREDIANLLDDENYDDGSYGPVLVRLAWHASGTFDKDSKTGGSNGATMRFPPECQHGANAGLAVARKLLEPIKAKYPNASYADIWTLAGVVAIEEMAGPKITWRPGRTDAPSAASCPPDGRLPDAAQGAKHLRFDVFYRMGFNDREIVALAGAHALGRCHTDRSGYSGPWTNAPTTFSNEYFVQLLNNKWSKKKWSGPEQFEDPTGKLMMLPADMALIEDPEFRKWVEAYAKDDQLFFKDFAKAFQKLEELGCNFPSEKPWYQFW